MSAARWQSWPEEPATHSSPPIPEPPSAQYTADPEKDPTATKFSEITYDEVYTRGLKVMDLTATALCKENHMPIIVFDMDTPGNLAQVLAGEPIGTLVY